MSQDQNSNKNGSTKFTMIQRFDHPNQKTIFRFIKNDTIVEKTVNEIFADRLLIKKLRPEDAIIIGFVLAKEQIRDDLKTALEASMEL